MQSTETVLRSKLEEVDTVAPNSKMDQLMAQAQQI